MVAVATQSSSHRGSTSTADDVLLDNVSKLNLRARKERNMKFITYLRA